MIESTDRYFLENYRKPMRRLASPDDWGDAATIGICLKRHNYNYGENDFGIYLGQYPEGWVVGIQDIGFEVIKFEVFESLEELKNEWICD